MIDHRSIHGVVKFNSEPTVFFPPNRSSQDFKSFGLNCHAVAYCGKASYGFQLAARFRQVDHFAESHLASTAQSRGQNELPALIRPDYGHCFGHIESLTKIEDATFPQMEPSASQSPLKMG